MPRKSQRLVYLSIITLISIGLIGYSDYKSNQKLVNSEQWVQHTERVIYESGNIFSVAKDIELASQGCVITNDSAFLKATVTPQVIFASITLLRQLTLDDPAQQVRIDSLTLYMKRYLIFSFQTVDIRSKKGFAQAVAFIATNHGKYYADRIAQVTAAIQQEENGLLKQRIQTNERGVAAFKLFSVLMLIVVGIFAVVLLITSGKYLLQNVEKEKRAAELVVANKELDFQNQEKEKRAQELIIANKELVFQNEEKEKRAAELIIANEELCFQNQLKEKAVLERVQSEKRHARVQQVAHSEIKLAEDKIDFDRNNLAALINNTDDLMWSIDMDLQLITSNEAFNKVAILTTGKPLRKGENIFSSYANENRWNTFKILYEKALKGDTFTILDRLDYPAELWSEVSFYPLRNGDAIIGTACFSRDVTQRTKNERAFRAMEQEILNQKVQEQKKITRAILNAQEKERNHIGQELHDNISQILASSKLFLSSAGQGNEVLKDLVKYPMELIDSSIQEIRLLSSRHVTPLKNVDLRELVQSLLDGLRENTLINTAFKYNVDNRELNDDLKLNIYRIIQEQINNIVKHASPQKIDISVQAEHNVLHIEMKDDGKGFDVNMKRKGIGLSNMMNRIESFNGQMLIESSIGKGCSVQIDIPY
jgi:signal transduction histidine kinase